MGCSGIAKNNFNCKSRFVENKKHNLCPDCNFFRIHGITRLEYKKRLNAEKQIAPKEINKEICCECGKEPVVNKIHKLGYNCNRKRIEKRREELGLEPKEKKKSVIKSYKKETGELELFKEIWSERPHKSEIDGTPLGDEMLPIFFSHVLSKGAYPSFRLDKRNIFLKTPEQHQSWEFGSKQELKKDPNWNKVFERFDMLKFEYYNGKKDWSE